MEHSMRSVRIVVLATLTTVYVEAAQLSDAEFRVHANANLRALSWTQSSAPARPSARISEIESRKFLSTVLADLADPQYAEAVKDLERSNFRILFTTEAKKTAPAFTGDPVGVINETA